MVLFRLLIKGSIDLNILLFSFLSLRRGDILGHEPMLWEMFMDFAKCVSLVSTWEMCDRGERELTLGRLRVGYWA